MKLRLVSERCPVRTLAGYQCWNYVVRGHNACWIHLAKRLMDSTFGKIENTKKVAK